MSKRLSRSDRAYINLSNESSRTIAKKLGCGKSTINDYRKKTNSVHETRRVETYPPFRFDTRTNDCVDLEELYPQLKEMSDDYYKGYTAVVNNAKAYKCKPDDEMTLEVSFELPDKDYGKDATSDEYYKCKPDDYVWDDSKCYEREPVDYCGWEPKCEPFDIHKIIKKTYVKQVVGIIGDTHLPYEHKDYLQFCIDTFREQGVTRVIHIGDLIDNHSLSFHDSETSLQGSRGELIDAKSRLKPWFEAFPNVTVIKGNHDRIPARQLKKIGLDPSTYMRRLSEVYEFPEGWKEEDHVFLDGVLYHHGETACGVNGFRKDSTDRMCNTVTGHAHGNCGVSYTATEHRMVFGVAVGCGIDNKSMAFAYGKNFKNKPIVSCAVVYGGKNPQVFAMDLGEKP